ncbi:T9SS type A sorting domain-containing protein [Pontibacter chitinilyticus]|uniref:T9SS type A sorting domain-containing protein n=1 Tax=Pontibacter chitinilyticus TaxID=2674989 RepID=UPI003218F3AC
MNLQATAVTNGSTSGLSYSYFTDASATKTLANPSAVATSGTYYIKGTTAAGCSDIKPVTVTINPLPTVTLNSFNPICVNAPVLTLSGGLPAGGTYSGPGVNGNGVFNPVAAGGAGTYTITYTYTNNNQCSSSASQTITVTNPPTVTLANFASVCVDNGSVTLSGGLPAGGTYSGTGVANGIFNPSQTGAGTYDITYTVFENGCSSSQTKSITVNPLPDVTLTVQSPVCVNAPAFALTGGRVGGTVPTTGTGVYSGKGVTNGSFDPAVAGVGTHNIKYTYTDANGCSSFATQAIVVNPLATVTLSPFADVCAGSEAFTLTGGLPAGGTYSGQGVTNGKFNPAVAGTYTITYTYQATNECENSASQTITVKPLPAVTVTSNLGICPGESATLTAQGADSYIWSPSTGLSATTGASVVAKPAVTTTYTVIGTSNGCQSEEKKVTVTVNPLPDVTITPTGPTEFCSGNYVDLVAKSNSTYSYAWFKEGNDTSIGNESTLRVNKDNGTGRYSVTITTDAGCTLTSETIAVKVADVPEVATIVTTGATTFCQGGSVRFDANKPPVGQTYVYQWEVSDNGIDYTPVAANGEARSYTASTSGYYRVLVSNTEVADENTEQCTKTSVAVQVVVLPQPVASITSGNQAQCRAENGATTFTVTGTFSGGTATWASANSNFVISNREDVVNSGTGVTTSSVTVSVSGSSATSISSSITLTASNSAATCSPANSSVTLTVKPLPVATITANGPTTFCENGSVKLTASTGTSWLWSTGATTQSIDVNQSGSYTVQVKNSNDCAVTSAATTVTVNPLPTVTLAAFAPVCKNGDTFSLSGGAPANGTYTVDGTAVTQFNPANYTVGNHTIVYTYTNGNTCSNTATQTIQVKAVPTVTLGSFADICVNAAALTLSGGSPAGGTYSGTGVANGVFNPATAGVGTHTITYQYESNGCISTATSIIKVTAQPTATLAAFSNVCVNATSFALTGGSPAGGTYSGTGVNNGQFNPATAGVGTHTITYTYNSNGCTVSATSSITVNPLPTATAGTYAAQCVGAVDKTTFALSGTVTNGTPTWAFVSGTNGATATITNGNTLTPTVTVNGTGTVTIRLTATSNTNPGCSPAATSTTVLTVNPLPVVSITAPSASAYCASAPVITLAGNQSGGSFTVDGVAATTFNPGTLATGNHTIIYSYTNSSGCTNSVSKTVTINPLPTVSFTGLNNGDVLYTGGNNIALVGNPSGGTFTSSTGTGLSGNTFNPCSAGPGTYTITYTYSNGTCSNSIQKTITVKESKYTVVVKASPFPICRGQNTDYTAYVYRDIAGVVYPYKTNSLGQPVNDSNQPISDGDIPTLNPDYFAAAGIDPNSIPSIIRSNAWRFYQPIVNMGSGVIANQSDIQSGTNTQFDYTWTKNNSNPTNGLKKNAPSVNEAGLSSTDWYSVQVSSKPNVFCTPLTKTLANRMYLSEPDGYTMTMATVAPWCYVANDPGSVTLTAQLGNLPGGWASSDLTYVWYISRNGQNIALTGQLTYSGGTTISTTQPKSKFQNGDRVFVDFNTNYDTYSELNSKCLVTSESDRTSITIDQPAAITANLSSNTVCEGTASTTFTVQATGTNLQYAWYKGTPNGTHSQITNQAGKYAINSANGSLQISNVVVADDNSYYVVVSNNSTTSACANTVTSSTAQLRVTPLPVQFAMNGGGGYCVSDNTGVSIGLSGSQNGVNYQLYRDNILVTTKNGTGNSFSFPNQTAAGIYTVKATTIAANGTAAECPRDMLGTATVTINQLPTVTASSPEGCTGSAATVTATPAGGSGTYTTYTWTVPSGWTGPVPTTASFTTTVPGEYKVRVADDRACTSSEAATTTLTFKAPVVREEPVLKVAWNSAHTEWQVTAEEVAPIKPGELGLNPTYVWYRRVTSAVTSEGEWGSPVQTGISNTYTETAPAQNVQIKAEIYNGNSCTQFRLTNIGVSILPVEIMYLKAGKQGNNVVLNWATAQEINNAGFEVQVSEDGRTFRKLAFVPTRNGNATMKQEYEFTDKENGKHGTRYYRLKQLDTDGTFEYFGPKAVTFDQVADNIKVYPNPFFGEVTLDIAAEHTGEMLIQVHNAVGKQLLQRKVHVEKGVTSEKLMLGAGLPKGVYFITTQLDGQIAHFKLLKE